PFRSHAPPFVRRRWYLALLVPPVVAAAVLLGTELALPLALAFAAVAGLLTWQAEASRVQRRKLRIEAQLADAIDLMVGALRAGGSAPSALENAAVESRAPLRPQLEEVLGRIRYGDDPQAVFHALAAVVLQGLGILWASALSRMKF